MSSAVSSMLAGALLSFASLGAQAQDPPMEWEEIPKADLSSTTFGSDTSVSAMVLGDYGESRLNNELHVVFTRHTRIKIFSPAGFTWGTRTLTLYAKEDLETLDHLEGATYALGAGGDVERTILDKSAIFEEKVDDEHTRYRFAFPALKPGCVIEFRYTITRSSSLFFPPWTFQASIPVRWSEYRVIEPRAMAYVRATKGYEVLAVNEETETSQPFSGVAASYFGERMVACRQYRWAMRDLPPLKEEPFMTTVDDYASSVELQLAEYAHPGGGTERVLKTWKELVDELVKSESLGQAAEPTGAVRDLTAGVVAGKESVAAKLAAIYDYVRSTFVWDGRLRVFGGGDVPAFMQTRKGSSADINLLLVSMLRSAGIQADPVLISTRSNGVITDIYPLVSQFNAILVRANAGGTQYFLDATDPLRGSDLLPQDALNVRGLVLSEGRVEWVVISSNRMYVHRLLADVTLDSAGGVRGRLESADDGYAAYFRRKDLEGKKSLEFAREVFDAERSGLSLDSIAITGQDSLAGGVRIRARVSAPAVAQVSGEYVYLTQSIVDRVKENPFKLKVRKFPVDMAYARSLSRSTVIHIPGGYEVKELPGRVEFSVGADEARFTRSAVQDKGTVQVLVRMQINVTRFAPSRYEALRTFYDRIVAAEADQIVLQKAPPPKSPESQKPARRTKSSKP